MPFAPAKIERSQPERATAPHRKVYKTAAWKRHREMRLAQEPICPMCTREGIEGAESLAVDVHHVVALRDGGHPFDSANTQPLCRRHHSALTRSGK